MCQSAKASVHKDFDVNKTNIRSCLLISLGAGEGLQV